MPRNQGLHCPPEYVLCRWCFRFVDAKANYLCFSPLGRDFPKRRDCWRGKKWKLHPSPSKENSPTPKYLVKMRRFNIQTSRRFNHRDSAHGKDDQFDDVSAEHQRIVGFLWGETTICCFLESCWCFHCRRGKQWPVVSHLQGRQILVKERSEDSQESKLGILGSQNWGGGLAHGPPSCSALSSCSIVCTQTFSDRHFSGLILSISILHRQAWTVFN